jgi:hypothetical protein
MKRAGNFNFLITATISTAGVVSERKYRQETAPNDLRNNPPAVIRPLYVRPTVIPDMFIFASHPAPNPWGVIDIAMVNTPISKNEKGKDINLKYTLTGM